jgi:hypothetical protein
MSRIWVPKVKILEPNKTIELRPKLDRNSRGRFAPRQRSLIGGRFRLFATRIGSSTPRPLTGWFHNLIVTQALNRIGSDSDDPGLFGACAVGTGNTAPAAGDTALQAQVAITTTLASSSSSILSISPYTYSRYATYRFSPGMGPVNIAEVGVGRDVTGTLSVSSRALILDGGGSPTTVAVDADEYLDVAYEIQHHPFLVDIEDTVNIAGESRDITVRWSNVTSSNGWSNGNKGPGGGLSTAFPGQLYSGVIGAITGAPAGSASSQGEATNAPYSNDSFQKACDVLWGITLGNYVGGIPAVRIQTGTRMDIFPGATFGAMQIGIDPPIMKELGDILTLNFNTSWDKIDL